MLYHVEQADTAKQQLVRLGQLWERSRTKRQWQTMHFSAAILQSQKYSERWVILMGSRTYRFVAGDARAAGGTLVLEGTTCLGNCRPAHGVRRRRGWRVAERNLDSRCAASLRADPVQNPKTPNPNKGSHAHFTTPSTTKRGRSNSTRREPTYELRQKRRNITCKTKKSV